MFSTVVWLWRLRAVVLLGNTEKSGDEKIATTRVAIVGFGLVGHRHAMAIKETDNVHLCAVVDPAGEAAKKAEDIGVPCYKTLEELSSARVPMALSCQHQLLFMQRKARSALN